MKTIGLIGGISWVSTIDYYRHINKMTNDRLSGLDAAKCIIYSLNFGDIFRNNESNNPSGTLQLITNAAIQLENAGSDCILICANTMHMHAEKVQEKINIPLIHIAVETAIEIKKRNLKKVALLGTSFTMEMDFYKLKLRERNIETIIPGMEDRSFIHTTIFQELGVEVFKSQTKNKYISIINKLREQGAEGVILGCTEIPLLIKQCDCSIPVFDTTFIHSQAAVDFALSAVPLKV